MTNVCHINGMEWTHNILNIIGHVLGIHYRLMIDIYGACNEHIIHM